MKLSFNFLMEINIFTIFYKKKKEEKFLHFFRKSDIFEIFKYFFFQIIDYDYLSNHIMQYNNGWD